MDARAQLLLSHERRTPASSSQDTASRIQLSMRPSSLVLPCDIGTCGGSWKRRLGSKSQRGPRGEDLDWPAGGSAGRRTTAKDSSWRSSSNDVSTSRCRPRAALTRSCTARGDVPIRDTDGAARSVATATATNGAWALSTLTCYKLCKKPSIWGCGLNSRDCRSRDSDPTIAVAPTRLCLHRNLE